MELLENLQKNKIELALASAGSKKRIQTIRIGKMGGILWKLSFLQAVKELVFGRFLESLFQNNSLNSMMKSLEPTKPVKSIWENAGEVENQYITPTSMYITDDDVDKYIGLHFAGNITEDGTRYAVACKIQNICNQLGLIVV